MATTDAAITFSEGELVDTGISRGLVTGGGVILGAVTGAALAWVLPRKAA